MLKFSRLLLLIIGVAVFSCALPTAAKPAACPQHPKSLAGLQPPACLSDPTAPTLASLSGAPDATFLNTAVSAPTGSWPQVLGAGDFDGAAGDRRAQLGVGTERYFDSLNDRQLHVFALDGAGMPQRSYQLPAGASPEAAQPLDANQDGVSDLVLALAGQDALAVYTSATGVLSAPVLIELDAPADALAAIDLTGDFRKDLVAVVGDSLRFWFSTPGGLVALPMRVDYPNDGYNSLAVGDFNNDGYDDIAALRGAGYANGQVAIFFQHSGAFTAGLVLTLTTGGFAPSAIVAGDLDGDGQDDLAVTVGGNLPDTYLNLFYQKQSVLAATPVVLHTFHLPSAIVAADISHDGHEDLVLADDGWRTLSIFTQRDDGTFDPQYLAADIPYSDRYRPDALVIADLDGNGGLDAATIGQPKGLTVLTSNLAAPHATITEPAPDGASVPSGYVPVLGSASPGAANVQVRVKGLSNWQEVPVTNGLWQALVFLPADSRPYTIQARAVDAQRRVQAPWTERHVVTALVCYTIADNDGRQGSPDKFVQVDMRTAEATLVGATGTHDMEAMAFDPGSGKLYAADDERLGTIDPATGAFTRIGPEFGKGHGSQGRLELEEVQGLAFDPATGRLYAIARRESHNKPDLLFQVDPATGLHVADAFGDGIDYVPVTGSGVLPDVDDIAFAADGTFYGVSNDDGKGGVLITIQTSSGAAAVRGQLGVNDMEGLTVAPDGILYGTTGRAWRSTGDHLWTIDPATGAATLVGPFGIESDYEAITCLPAGVLLPTSPQALQPRLADLSINAGAADTTSPAVTVQALAVVSPALPAPAAVLLAEYGYNQAHQAWQPVGLPQRVSATEAEAGVAWSLQPVPGMHYLQAWAVDANGKVTRPALQAFINYLPDPATIAASEHQIYRYTLVAGEILNINLTSLTGDVDLVVWGPHGAAPLAVSTATTTDESITITATSSGIYQVEMIGASAATYRLGITRTPPAAMALATDGNISQVVAVLATPKAEITAPHIPLSSEPDPYTIPATVMRLYLPVLVR